MYRVVAFSFPFLSLSSYAKILAREAMYNKSLPLRIFVVVVAVFFGGVVVVLFLLLLLLF